jgi:hypothetical protein
MKDVNVFPKNMFGDMVMEVLAHYEEQNNE